MFTIMIKTVKGENWYHCWGGNMSRDSKEAHSFKNIGRAKAVARQRYHKELGRTIKEYKIINTV